MSSNIEWVNFLNQWGLTLIGVSLILGVFIRWSTIAGVLLMALYYLADLSFPYIGANAYIVDSHIIYIFILVLLFVSKSGKNWGLDKYLRRN